MDRRNIACQFPASCIKLSEQLVYPSHKHTKHRRKKSICVLFAYLIESLNNNSNNTIPYLPPLSLCSIPRSFHSVNYDQTSKLCVCLSLDCVFNFGVDSGFRCAKIISQKSVPSYFPGGFFFALLGLSAIYSASENCHFWFVAYNRQQVSHANVIQSFVFTSFHPKT